VRARPQRLALACTLVALAAGGSASAAEPTVSFSVARTDTLISLSRSVLVSPEAWREVARLNRLTNPNRIRPGQVLQIPTRLLRADVRGARLVSAHGEVKVGDAPASSDAALSEGQTVQTGAGSSAVIELADGSRVRLPPSSLAQITASRQLGTRSEPLAGAAAQASDGWFAGTLRVLRGSVEVIASKVQRAKPLEVVTPTAIIGVRGTRYRVALDAAENAAGTEQRTRGEVVEGLVRLDLPAGAQGVDIGAGFGAATDPSGALPRVVRLPAAPDLGAVPERFERPMVRFALPGETTPLRVQVASDAGFDKIVQDQRVAPGAEVRIAGLDDARWYLRARRVDAQGIEGFDATRPFVLKARPEPPLYRAPTSGAKQQVGAVEFAWAQNTGAPRARLQVASDEGFKTLVLDRDGLTEATLRAELPAPGTYYWRMASIRPDGDNGPFGDAQRFELRDAPATPSGAATKDGSAILFTWAGRPQDRQQVEFASDPEFKTVEARAELTAPAWSVPKPSRGGRYYFRYRSVEPDGYVTPYSETAVVEVPRDWRPLLMLLVPLVLL